MLKLRIIEPKFEYTITCSIYFFIQSLSRIIARTEVKPQFWEKLTDVHRLYMHDFDSTFNSGQTKHLV